MTWHFCLLAQDTLTLASLHVYCWALNNPNKGSFEDQTADTSVRTYSCAIETTPLASVLFLIYPSNSEHETASTDINNSLFHTSEKKVVPHMANNKPLLVVWTQIEANKILSAAYICVVLQFLQFLLEKGIINLTSPKLIVITFYHLWL